MANERRKVFIAITQSVFGGAQRYVLDIASSLPKSDFDVTVIHGGSGIFREKLQSINIRTIPLMSLERKVSVWNDIKTLKELLVILRKEKPKILHINSSKMGILGGIAGRLVRIPRIIFTAHGWAFNEERPYWQKISIYILSALTILMSHRTIAVSEAMRNAFRKLPFVYRKMSVIRNGIGEIFYEPRINAREKIAALAGIKSDSNEMWVGTVAELHPTKNLPVGISAFKEALKKCPGLRYIIIGEGAERVALEQSISARGLGTKVHLLGFVNNASQFLKAFDVFLLPSLSESFSYAILEAGKVGLPIVASRVGGIPEIIEHNRTGILVEPRDVSGFANGLSECILDKNKGVKMGENLQSRILSDFTIKQMVEKTIAVY